MHKLTSKYHIRFVLLFTGTLGLIYMKIKMAKFMHCVKSLLSYVCAMEPLCCPLIGYIRKFSNMQVAVRQLSSWVEYFQKI